MVSELSVPARLKADATAAKSPQSSLSKELPASENTPTTSKGCLSSEMREPTSSPSMRRCARLPTMISDNPARGRRPSRRVTPFRSLRAAGVTPRTPRFVSWPSLLLGRATTSTSSGEASGVPSEPCSTRGSSATQSPAASLKDDPSSDNAPFCRTIALPALPLALSARRNPLAIDSNAMNTATTSAIPVTARRVDFQRTPRLPRLYVSGRATLNLLQQLDDSAAIGRDGREQARHEPDQHAEEDSRAGDRGRYAHSGEFAHHLADDGNRRQC